MQTKLHSMLKLSIIVPVCNVEPYIRPCFESIFKQGLDENDYEVIIVNDGSTDRSMEMIADIISQHNNITVINQKNQGLSVARNNGITASKGEYILMPDSDDLLIESSIPPLLKTALETKVEIIVADYLMMNNYEIDQRQYNKIKQPYISTKEMTGVELLKEIKACYVWNKLYRRDFILQNHISFIPGIHFQDIPFTHECYIKAQRCIKANSLLNIYRRGHSSASDPNSFDTQKAHDLSTAIAATWELSKNKQITPDIKEAIKKNLLATYHNFLFRILKYTDDPSVRIELLRDLSKKVPDLHFTGNIYQRIGNLLYRMAPRLYLTILSKHWGLK